MPVSEECFRSIGLFAWLPVDALRWLSRKASTRSLLPGKVLFEPGSPAEGLYVIESGQLSFDSPDLGKSHLEAGNYFGELCLIDPRPRTSRASARTAVVCHLLRLEDLQAFARLHPDPHSQIMTNLARELAHKIRRLNTLQTLQLATSPP